MKTWPLFYSSKIFFIVMNAKVILLDLSTNLFEKTQKRAFVLRGIYKQILCNKREEKRKDNNINNITSTITNQTKLLFHYF
jgi:hypothetical protein